MEVRFVTNAVLRRLSDSISELTSDVKFDFRQNGLAIQAMDNANVALFVVFINKNDTGFFSKYEVEENVTLDINMKSLATGLKTGDSHDSVTMIMQTAGDDILKIVFQHPETAKKTTFSLRLMMIEYEPLAVPETEYAAVVTMPADTFRITIGTLQTVGDATDITVKDDAIQFDTTGTVGSVQTELGVGNDITITTQEDSKYDLKLSFALRYLSIFGKTSALSSTVTLSMSPDLPMSVRFPVGNPVKREGKQKYISYIQFYLAPKYKE